MLFTVAFWLLTMRKQDLAHAKYYKTKLKPLMTYQQEIAGPATFLARPVYIMAFVAVLSEQNGRPGLGF